MDNEKQASLINEYEKEYIEFMGIKGFPEYKLEFFEINMDEVDEVGFATPAQAKYNPKTGIHTLRVCSNFEMIKYIVFHEFTHILDAEMYARQDPVRYAYLSGYTEYHASQIELMVLLEEGSICLSKGEFSIDTIIKTFPFEKRIEDYVYSRHQFVVDMMNRTDFPVNFEKLKTTLGALYNYFGLRSICKMYIKDYVEKVDNTAIIKWIPLNIFNAMNTWMNGWFDKSKIEMSFGPYSNAIMPIIEAYKLL